MIKYIKNPPEYDAIRFEGGRESARYVTNFLADHDIHSSWYDKFAPIEVAPAEDDVDGEPTFIDGREERIVIELGDEADTMITVEVGRWIVVDEDHQVGIYTDTTFPIFYSKKPVSD